MDINIVKRLTIAALVSDEILMKILVLKGGNALDLAYDITNRGSVDIDFSMETDFTDEEKARIRNQIEFLLNNEFSKEGYVVFDVKLIEKPSIIEETVKEFWGGYLVEFKVIPNESYSKHKSDIDALRRNAVALHSDNSTKFTIDISKYEYVTTKVVKDIEGSVVYVYSPEMIALEKLRALCQQNIKYKQIVKRMTPKPRARDFFDVYNINESFKIDFASEENLQLCQNIFSAKRVPLTYISELPNQRELHKQSWQSVIDTVDQSLDLEDYSFYFDYVIKLFSHI